MGRIADPRYESPSLLLPYERSGRRLSVDWGKALARDLVFFAAGDYDVVTQEPAQPISTNHDFSVNEYGQQVESTSDTAGGVAYYTKIPQGLIKDEWSWVFHCRLDSYAGGDTWFGIINAQTNWSTPYGFGLTRNSANTNVDIFYGHGASAYTQIFSGFGFFPTDGLYHQLAATKPTDGAATVGNCKFYKDGELHSSGASGGGATETVWFNGSAAFPVVLQRKHYIDSGEGYTGPSNYAGLWARVLSAEEIRALYLNPYQMLIPI